MTRTSCHFTFIHHNETSMNGSERAGQSSHYVIVMNGVRCMNFMEDRRKGMEKINEM